VTEIPLEEWHHVAGTYDSAVGALIYVDGVAEANNPDLDGVAMNEMPFYLGENPESAGRFLDGMLDDVRIYDGALSADEIMELATIEPVPTDPGADGLIAYYALDGDVLDSSANMLDGTIMGEPNFVEGQVGMALQLDGVDDYVDCGNDPLFDVNEAITLSVWVNTNDSGNGEHNPWMGKGDHVTAIKHFNGNSVEFFLYDGTWIAARYPVDETFNGTWHHAVGTFDGAQLKLYIDGELEATTDHEGSIETRDHSVNLGRNSENTDRLYDGVLDEAMMYNRALSAGEVRYLAGFRAPVDPGTDGLVAAYSLEGDVLDASDNMLDGIIMGDPNFVGGVVGMALDLDGIDDYVDCGTNEELNGLSEKMTVATWVSIRSITTAWMAIAGKGETAWRLSVNNDTTSLHFGFSGGDRGWLQANSVTEIPLEEWHHLAGVYDNEVGATVYVDGVPETVNADLGGTDMNEMPFYLGENPESAGRFLDGMLDEVVIYGRALSGEEILYLASK
jgi:hypothetical protein